MAEFRFPCGVLKNLLAAMVIMADDADIFFDPNRGLRLKLVCFIGCLDGAVFFRKESLRDFQCLNLTSACIELMELEKALARIDTNYLIALRFDVEELTLHLRTQKFGR